MKERIAYRSYLEGFDSSRLPRFTEEEKEYIRGTSDFFCIQTYIAYVTQYTGEQEFDSPPSFVKDMTSNITPSLDTLVYTVLNFTLN